MDNETSQERDILSIEFLDTLDKKNALSFEEMYKYLEDEGFGSDVLTNFKNSKLSTEEDYYYQFFSLEPIIIENEKFYPEILIGLDYKDSEISNKIVSLNFAKINNPKDYALIGKIEYFLESGNSFYVVTSGDIYENKDYSKDINFHEYEACESAIVDFSINSEQESKYIKNIYHDQRGYFPSLDK